MNPFHVSERRTRVRQLIAVDDTVVVGAQYDQIVKALTLIFSLARIVSLGARLSSGDVTYVGNENAVLVEQRVSTAWKRAAISG